MQTMSKDVGLKQGIHKLFVRGPLKDIPQQFEGRTSWVIWLFRDMLHSAKLTHFS